LRILEKPGFRLGGRNDGHPVDETTASLVIPDPIRDPEACRKKQLPMRIRYDYEKGYSVKAEVLHSFETVGKIGYLWNKGALR
jgi:hypothetical protein